MRFDLSSRNTKILQEQKRHRQWMIAFLVLSVTVVLGTAAALKLYGQALTHKVKVLDCRAGVHEHTEECYVYDEEAGEDVPVCGYADYLVHIHNDDCRDKNGRLVCPLEEIEPHKHTDECYEERRVLVCGLEGIEPAQGADTDAAGTAGNQSGQTPGGGAESQPVKTTEAENQPEQTSGAQSQPAQEAATEAPSTEAPTTEAPTIAASAKTPVETESKLACAEEEHTHTNDCYGEAALSCGLEEHKHGDACYEMTLTCETPEHAHESGCYDENGELICGFEEHEHGDSCYEKTLTCETPEHEHGDACYSERELTCKKKEHAHTDACYAEVAVETTAPAETKAPETKAPETKAAETTAMSEAKAAETTAAPTTAESETTAVDGAGTHVHTDACYETRLVPVCGKLELHTHDEDCYDEDGRLICELPQLEQHTHNKDCFKTVELTDEEIAALNAGVKLHIHHEDCYDENGKLICGHEETHIHGEKCYDKDGKLICGHDEAHVHSDDCYDENGDIICGLEVVAHEHTDDCYDENGKLVCDHVHIHEESCFDEDGNMTCDFEDVGDYLWTCEGEDYTVTARFTEEAGIPGNAKLEAEQITADEDAEHFAQREEEYREAVEDETADMRALLRIGFYVENKDAKAGESQKTEIEPKAPVTVTVQLLNEDGLAEGNPVTVVHFAEDGTELLDGGEAEDNSTTFEIKSFSEIAIGHSSESAGNDGSVSENSVSGNGIDVRRARAATGSITDRADDDGRITLSGSETITIRQNETLKGQWFEVPEGADVTIDLNGYTIEQTEPRDKEKACLNQWGSVIFSVFDVKGTLTIADSGQAGKGTITANNTMGAEIDAQNEEKREVQYSLFYVRGGGVLNIQGGILKIGGYHTRVVYAEEEEPTTVNMSGGTVTGGNGTWGGGGIFVAEGVINISGGKITENSAGEGGGIYAAEGTVVNISKDGEIFKNTATADSARGGGVETLDTLRMTGGKIYQNVSNCSGGGVHVHLKGSMQLTGGEIYENTAGIDNKGTTNKGGGGGVYAVQMEMSGGKIHNNRTLLSGGGVYAKSMKMTGGEIYKNEVKEGNAAKRGGGGIFIAEGLSDALAEWIEPEVLPVVCQLDEQQDGEPVKVNCNMSITGGIIRDNTSYHTGGGIFVDVGAVAYINGENGGLVEIKNNSANDIEYVYGKEGAGHGFAGGGIFVEHPDQSDPNLPATAGGHIYIYNAVITNNKAQHGGGVAGCGTSDVNICSVNGVAIYGNTARGAILDGEENTLYRASDDVYADGSGTIDSMMMGGVQAGWHGILDDREMNVDKKESFSKGCYLSAGKFSDDDKAKIRQYATVIIEGNYSKSGGGGVGGNGFIKLGLKAPELEETYSLKLQKKVEGRDEDTNEFLFAITLIDKENKPLESVQCSYVTVGDDGASVSKEETVMGENGAYNFKLKSGDYIEIKNLQVGTQYTIQEEQFAGYKPSIEVSPSAAISEGNDEVSGWIAEDTKVIFTNTAVYQLPETGGMGTNLYTMAGALCFMLGAGFMYRKNFRGRRV